MRQIRYAVSMPSIRDLFATWVPRFQQALAPMDSATAYLETELLLAHVLKKDRAWIIAHEDARLTPKQHHLFETLTGRRLLHEPMVYLLGYRAFYGRDFYTDRRVLIPRPETEQLVEHALTAIKKPSSCLVWDVGTGSGAIAVTVACEKRDVQIFASDIGTLELAKKNARRYGASIRFFHGSLLNQKIQKALATSRHQQWIVIANLPYLPLSDKKILMKDVVNFEPKAALFAPENGLAYNRKLLEQLARYTRQDSRPVTIFLEFDPPQMWRLKTIAERLFPHAVIRVFQDFCGRDRVMEIKTKKI